MALKYPAVLTNKDWQKNKGLLARSKPTGIGEKLVALEKAYNQSFFANADPKTLGTDTADPLLFQRRLDTFTKTIVQQGTKIEQLVQAADKTIKAAMPLFAKDKQVSKYLETLGIALKGLSAELKATGYPRELHDEITKVYKVHVSNTSMGQYFKDNIAGKAETSWKTVMSEVKQLEANPQVATIAKLWKGDGPHRLVPTNAKMWDQLIARDFPEVVKSIYGGKAMADYANLPWIRDVGNENMGNATNAVQALAQRTDEQRAVSKMALEYSRSLITYHDLVNHIAAVQKAVTPWLV